MDIVTVIAIAAAGAIFVLFSSVGCEGDSEACLMCRLDRWMKRVGRG